MELDVAAAATAALIAMMSTLGASSGPAVEREHRSQPMWHLKLSLCIVAWFGSSAVCSFGTKHSLNELAPQSCAVSLTTLQFIVAAVLGGLIYLTTGQQLAPGCRFDVARISLAYTLGFLFFNMSYGRLAASFAETAPLAGGNAPALRSSHPAPSCGRRCSSAWHGLGRRPRPARLARLGRRPRPAWRAAEAAAPPDRRAPPGRRCAAWSRSLPLRSCAPSGRAAARSASRGRPRWRACCWAARSVATPSASMRRAPQVGLVLGLLSNGCFAARSLCTSMLQDRLRRQRPLPPSQAGADAHADADCGASGADAPGPPARAPELSAAAVFFYQHLLGLAVMIPVALFEDARCARGVLAPAAGAGGATRGYVASSALAFYAYNQLSLVALLMLNPLAHSVANACRRCVTILSAALLFGTLVSPAGAGGIALVIGGAVCYVLSQGGFFARCGYARPGWRRPMAGSSSEDEEEGEGQRLKAPNPANGDDL